MLASSVASLLLSSSSCALVDLNSLLVSVNSAYKRSFSYMYICIHYIYMHDIILIKIGFFMNF